MNPQPAPWDTEPPIQRPGWANDAEARALLAEAEGLLDGMGLGVRAFLGQLRPHFAADELDALAQSLRLHAGAHVLTSLVIRHALGVLAARTTSPRTGT